MIKVNNYEVKPLISKSTQKTYKYNKIWSCPYIISFILAPRGWGKTTIIYNILSQIGWRKSNIYIFWWTLNNDLTLKEMIKKLKKNNINVFMQTDISIDDDNNNNNNMLSSYTPKYIDKLDEIYQEWQIFIEQNYKKFESEKYLYAINILIFDDMWAFLKNNKILWQMAKNGRHLKLIILIASQYLMDISQDVRANLWHIILFGSIGEKKLKNIYEEKIISGEVQTFEKFINIYNIATEKKFDFLFIDVFNNKFYKNFNYLIDITKL